MREKGSAEGINLFFFSSIRTCSASDAHRHTLSVKCTGRVENRAGFGKNGHHHRDRDGRIALGPGDRATSITCSASDAHRHTLSVKSTGRVEKRAVFGKNGHHHRDRDGRIALGPGDRGI